MEMRLVECLSNIFVEFCRSVVSLSWQFGMLGRWSLLRICGGPHISLNSDTILSQVCLNYVKSADSIQIDSSIYGIRQASNTTKSLAEIARNS